jgi:hypothetical protein
VDAAGNLYIADRGKPSLRKVDAGGTITTVAGNGTRRIRATAAQLQRRACRPRVWRWTGRETCTSGIRETHRLRKVGAAVRSRRSRAMARRVRRRRRCGNGSAAFQSLWLGSGHGGNVYIADSRQPSHPQGRPRRHITTVAGTGTSGFSGDGARNGGATVNRPLGVAVDSGGEPVHRGSSNSLIRKVDAGGTITTVAGNGTPGYSGDDGAATAASLYEPSDVVIDLTGNLLHRRPA